MRIQGREMNNIIEIVIAGFWLKYYLTVITNLPMKELCLRGFLQRAAQE